MPANRTLAWGLIAVLAAAGVWLLRDMLLPFVAGLALAYLLDPPTDRLERMGVRRWLAATVVLSCAILVALAVALLFVPVLGSQILTLAGAMPGYAVSAREAIVPMIAELHEALTPDQVAEIQASASDALKTALGWTGRLISGLWSGGMALVDAGSLLVITPVVAFYLLRDWPGLIATLDSLLPRGQRPVIHHLGARIDDTLAGFVRGQASVCALLALFYALALSLAGLQFGLVVGLIAGLFSFIPYVGTALGLGLSLGLALLQFETSGPILIVALVFFAGQVLEGYVLTPKLVGDRVGLHPVWVMFALLAGASLIGFLGVLIAVPAAAVLGVLVRFAVERYRDSDLYHSDSIAGEKPGQSSQGMDGRPD